MIDQSVRRFSNERNQISIAVADTNEFLLPVLTHWNHAAQLAIELDRSLQIAHLNADVLNGFRLNSRGRKLSRGAGCRSRAYDSDKLSSGKPIHEWRLIIGSAFSTIAGGFGNPEAKPHERVVAASPICPP